MRLAASWLTFAALCAFTLTAWIDSHWTLPAALAVALALPLLQPPAGLADVGPIAWRLLFIPAWGALQLAAARSVYPHVTLHALAYWCALAGIFAVADRLNAGADGRWMKRFVHFTGLLAALSLAQQFTSHGRFVWLFDTGYPDIFGPFPSYMEQAALFEIAIPFALHQTLRSSSFNWTFAGYASLMVAAVISSGSRAGTILVLLECLFVPADAIHFRAGLRRPAVTLAVLAVLCGALTAAAGSERVWNRLRNSNDQFRTQALAATVQLIQTHPWTGFGLGTFSSVYPGVARFDDGTRVNHAHNEWAEWTAEGGVQLLAVFAAIAWAALRCARRATWSIGLIAVLLHALVDYPLRRFAVTGWFVFVLACARQDAELGLSE